MFHRNVFHGGSGLMEIRLLYCFCDFGSFCDSDHDLCDLSDSRVLRIL